MSWMAQAKVAQHIEINLLKGFIMKKKQIEICFLCDEPTGGAGRLDDSLYNEEGKGPFCPKCWLDDQDGNKKRCEKCGGVIPCSCTNYKMDIMHKDCGGKIEECHPLSSGTGAYWVCDKCDAQFEEYEIDALQED